MTEPTTCQLRVILTSTRPVRAGEPIARWVLETARLRRDVDAEFIDLADVNLPLLDEPREPSDGGYVHEHTRRWSSMIEPVDAFVFVVPEYNHSFNAATKNALDFLYHEWRYKAAGIVCYGGGARGTRAAQHLKPVLSALKMIHVGDVAVGLNEVDVVEGRLDAPVRLQHQLGMLIDEAVRLCPHLRELRRTETSSR